MDSMRLMPLARTLNGKQAKACYFLPLTITLVNVIPHSAVHLGKKFLVPLTIYDTLVNGRALSG